MGDWKPMEWEQVEQLEDHYALREELRQTRIAHNKDIDDLIQAEQCIQRLEEALEKIRKRARKRYDRNYEEIADAALEGYIRRCPKSAFIAEDESVRCCLPEGHDGEHDWHGYAKLGIGRTDGWRAALSPGNLAKPPIRWRERMAQFEKVVSTSADLAAVCDALKAFRLMGARYIHLKWDSNGKDGKERCVLTSSIHGRRLGEGEDG